MFSVRVYNAYAHSVTLVDFSVCKNVRMLHFEGMPSISIDLLFLVERTSLICLEHNYACIVAHHSKEFLNCTFLRLKVMDDSVEK